MRPHPQLSQVRGPGAQGPPGPCRAPPLRSPQGPELAPSSHSPTYLWPESSLKPEVHLPVTLPSPPAPARSGPHLSPSSSYCIGGGAFMLRKTQPPESGLGFNIPFCPLTDCVQHTRRQKITQFSTHCAHTVHTRLLKSSP